MFSLGLASWNLLCALSGLASWDPKHSCPRISLGYFLGLNHLFFGAHVFFTWNKFSCNFQRNSAWRMKKTCWTLVSLSTFDLTSYLIQSLAQCRVSVVQFLRIFKATLHWLQDRKVTVEETWCPWFMMLCMWPGFSLWRLAGFFSSLCSVILWWWARPWCGFSKTLW